MGRRPFYTRGSLAERPDARRPGLFWHDTDTDKVYIDDGATWQEAGGVQKADPTRLLSYNVFIPGTLRPLTIATLANPGLASGVTLRYLEANLQSAPVGVDASNHIKAQVAGSVSGVQDVAMNSAVQRFAVDHASLVTIGRHTSGSTWKSDKLWVQPVQVTQDAEVGGITWRHTTGGSDTPRFAFLRDANDQVLAKSEVYNTEVSGWTNYAFPEGVQLTTGVTYQLGFMAGDVDLGWAPWNVTVYRNGTNSGAPPSQYLEGIIDMGSGIGKAAMGRSGTDETTPFSDLSTNPYLENPYVQCGLLGPPNAVPLAGDLALSLVGVGTVPPDPGADLNLTMRVEV